MTQPSLDLRRWQRRIFATVWITYFTYYFCRYNMPVAKSSLCAAYQWSAANIGAIFTALTLMYAIGQFVNGQLGDRFGTRLISTIGCAGSVLMNLVVFTVLLIAPDNGIAPARVLLLLITFWGINGFFQAMGWSPMVKAMDQWFPLKNRGKIMGWLGTCYQLGAACASLLAVFLVGAWVSRWNGDWRMVFLVPAVIFAVVGVFFFVFIRNRPEDVGLPPMDKFALPTAAGEVVTRKPRTLRANVTATLTNPHLWVVAGAFFMLDINRYGFVNWLPAYVMEAQSELGKVVAVSTLKTAMKIGIHPLAGSLGAIVCGWATDRFFGGRRAPVIAVTLVALGIFSILFTHVDVNNTAMLVTVIALIGFFTYGPHILMVGHAAQDFGHKEGAAGFIDSMGYIGASLAGWGAGRLIDIKDYDFTFVMAGICAFIGAALISILWKTKPRS